MDAFLSRIWPVTCFVATHVAQRLADNWIVMLLVCAVAAGRTFDVDATEKPNKPARPGIVATAARHAGPITSLSYNTDGDVLAVAARDDYVVLERSDALTAVDKCRRSGVRHLKFSPTGQSLALCGDDDIAIWAIDTRTTAVLPFAAPRRGSQVTFSNPLFTPSGKRLIAACDSNGGAHSICGWDIGLHTMPEQLFEHNSRIMSMDISADGDMVVSGDLAGNIVIVDPYRRGIVEQLRQGDGVKRAEGQIGFGQLFGSVDAVEVVRVSPVGDIIMAVIAQVPGGRSLWQARRTDKSSPFGKARALNIDFKGSSCRNFAFSPNGQVLAVAVGQERIEVISTSSLKPLAVCEVPKTKNTPADTDDAGAMPAIAFAPNGRNLAIGSNSGSVLVFGLPDEIVKGDQK